MTWPERLKRNAVARWSSIVLSLVLGGLLVMVSGIIPIKASSGHWAFTHWFLHFAMRRSVKTWSMLTVRVPPDFGTEAQIARGAGHYATGCAPCHGAPGEPPSEIMQQMTPEPPLLTAKIRDWDRKELFYIVRHGVKFTGMPAWPAQHRDDEVWSVVAFLLELPELTPKGYRQLAWDGEAPHETRSAGVNQAVAESLDQCVRCHGRDGRGRDNDAFPRLDLQREHYLRAALESYRKGSRKSGIMGPLARTLEEQEMAALAKHYAAAASSNVEAHDHPAPVLVENGRRIARHGLPDRRVPACVHCHGPGRVAENELFPELAGQHPDYIRVQLELFKSRHRGGTPYAKVMTEVAQGLESEEIGELAAYYGSLESNVEANQEN